MEERPLSKASCFHGGEQAPRGIELSYVSTFKSLALTCLLMLHLPKKVPGPSPKPVGGMSPTEKHGKNRERRKNRKQIQSAREKPLVMGVTLRRDETSPQFEVICISVW